MSEFQRTVVNGKEYSYPKSHYTDPNRRDGRRKEKKKGWQVAEMWENHHEIARRLILGQKGPEIAEALGCSTQLVSNVKNSPTVQEKLALMRAARDVGTLDLAHEIANLAPIALQRVKEALETGNVQGRELNGGQILKEANNLLDREIGKPTQRVDTRNLHGHFTLDDIDRIKSRAKELAGASGQMAFSDEGGSNLGGS